MSSNNTTIEKIDLYTRGKLSIEERELFEAELAFNEQLQRKVELSKIVDQMVVAKEALKLKEQMRKDLHESKPFWKNKGFLGMFIACLLAVSFMSIWKFSQKEKTEEQPPLHTKKVFPVNTEKNAISIPENKEAEKPNQLKESTGKNPNPIQNIDSSTGYTKVVEHSPEGSLSVKTEVPENNTIVEPDNTTVREPVKETDACTSLQKVVEYTVSPSCKGENTGEIFINPESVKGGTPPYTFISGDRQTKSIFENLPGGNYELKIVDAKGCMVEIGRKILVSEKICSDPKQYAFNPEYDHSWTIPYNTERSPVRITIMDRGGIVYYTSGVSDFHPAEWTGISNTGKSLIPGMYFFTLEYADGFVEEGSIMVTR